MMRSVLTVTVTVLLQLLVLFSPPTTTALPTGAASCIGNQAAVGGYHLDGSNERTVAQGELIQGGVALVIDGRRSLLPTAPVSLETGVDYTLTVSTSQPQGFQGILLRLEHSDGQDLSTGAIAPDFSDLQLQTAAACEAPVGGVTHTTADPKTEVTVRLRFSFPGAVYLDATLVAVNDELRSVFGYNRYELLVAGEPDTPPPSLPPGRTLSPTASPAPTAAPTAPVGTPSPTYGLTSSGARARTRTTAATTRVATTVTAATCAVALLVSCLSGWLL